MPNYNMYGYPYGAPYQPYSYGGYQGNAPQQGMNQMQGQPQQPQMNQYAFVNGIEGAKSFQLQPNQSILLMDSDSPVCYMKSANNVGQSTLRYFKLKEVSENDLRGVPQQSVNSSEYVLKSDFDVLNNKVNTLLDQLERPQKRENNKQQNKVNKDEQ